MKESILQDFRKTHENQLNELSESDRTELLRILDSAIAEELSDDSDSLWLMTSLLAKEPSSDVLRILRKQGIDFVVGT